MNYNYWKPTQCLTYHREGRLTCCTLTMLHILVSCHCLQYLTNVFWRAREEACQWVWVSRCFPSRCITASPRLSHTMARDMTINEVSTPVPMCLVCRTCVRNRPLHVHVNGIYMYTHTYIVYIIHHTHTKIHTHSYIHTCMSMEHTCTLIHTYICKCICTYIHTLAGLYHIVQY